MQGYVPARDRYLRGRESASGRLRTGWRRGKPRRRSTVSWRNSWTWGPGAAGQLFQDRLDATAAREERRHDVAGEDGVVRTRAEKGRERPLVTKFGQVTVSRIAYRSPGRPNVHPVDAVLNLPDEKHSHGLRKMAAIESARGSMEAAGAAITRATGVGIGKRQLEEMIRGLRPT